MEPISAIRPHPAQGLPSRHTPPVSRPVSRPVPHEIPAARQKTALPDQSDAIRQFPGSLANSLVQTFQGIETFAFQAAEIGIDTQTLEQLQALVDEALSSFTTTLDDISQENLQLLTALFQNPSITGLGSSAPSQNVINNDVIDDVFLTPQNLTENFPGNFLNINVTSEPGILAALTLAGVIIDLFSAQDTGTEEQGSLPGIPGRTLSRFPEETETAANDTGPSESELAFSRFLAATQYPAPIRTGRDTPTIIDFV